MCPPTARLPSATLSRSTIYAAFNKSLFLSSSRFGFRLFSSVLFSCCSVLVNTLMFFPFPVLVDSAIFIFFIFFTSLTLFTFTIVLVPSLN